MTEKVEIVERAAQKILLIRARVGVLRMPLVMGRSYRRILEYLSERGEAPAGAPVCRYTGFDWEALARESRRAARIKMFVRPWALEMGIPVSGDVAPGAGMEEGALAGGRYLQTLHRGPYRKVGEAYARLQRRMGEDGLAVRNESVEIYLNDPRTTPADELETLVLIPLDE